MSEDTPSPVSGSGTLDAPESALPPLVTWPPPGLERLRGDLWSVIDRLGMGGAIFTLPLLAALTLPQDPWRLGIYGDAWWVVLVTSMVGLWFVLGGYIQLFRALRRWRAATGRGYRARTVALVLADRPGDTGYLVQGGRAYSLIDERTRRALLNGRLAQVGLLVAAGLWLSGGFMTGVLMAARGMIGEGGLALWTLLPPALAVAVLVVPRAWENSVVLKARKAWHAKPWSEDLVRDEIRDWHAALADRSGAVSVPEGSVSSGSGALQGAAVATALLGVAMLLLAVPMVVTSGIGPVLAAISVPRFSATQAKAARSEALASLRMPVDASVTPLQAGEALQALTMRSPTELLKPPLRSYDPVFPNNEDRENPTGMDVHFWARDLVPRLADGLDPAVVTYLVELGRHPALLELGVMARAETLDEIGALYVLPLPEDMTWWEFPIPKYSGIRYLAYAQVGAAVGAAATGRVDEADTRLRELISAGLLMGRDGPTLISNLIGFVLAGVGGDALANLYAATGRPAESEALLERMRATERAARLGQARRGRSGISNMFDAVTDSSTIRGIRWEFLVTLSTLGPCLNLNRAVFGPPDDYQAWLDQARTIMVRTEGEEQLFQLVQRGWGIPGGDGGLQPVARLFAQVMGGGLGSCAELAAAVAR